MIEPVACLRCYRSRKHVKREHVSAQSPPAKVGTTRPSPEAMGGGAYRLSRIQAEGWTAAHRIAVSALDKLDGTQIELLNPYKSDPERTRWSAGFANALAY